MNEAAAVSVPHTPLQRARRLFVILLLGFASGLPLALTGGADVESLRARTAKLAESKPLYPELQQY